MEASYFVQRFVWPFGRKKKSAQMQQEVVGAEASQAHFLWDNIYI